MKANFEIINVIFLFIIIFSFNMLIINSSKNAKNNTINIAIILILLNLVGCSKKSSFTDTLYITPITPTTTSQSNIGEEVTAWITKFDATWLIQQKGGTIKFDAIKNGDPIIEIDTTLNYQLVDGFGYSLTGGSAYVINKMDPTIKANLLNELFGAGPNSIGVSYLRVSIGASDLSKSVFSYDDMPSGQTDINLTNFSLDKDLEDMVPVLQSIVAINPSIKILGSPWSPPSWMKDNNSSIGGSLQPQYYNVYANYFVKYIQAMKAKGITIDAITIQNEPQNDGNNPSMLMSSIQQLEFIKTNLGPAFKNAGINTKIIIWDHNCDNISYPVAIYNDSVAKSFVDGAAFHLYAGNIIALSTVHNAYPEKNIYFTEQWTSGTGTFDGDFKWHFKNVIIGSIKNWSKVALEWNLANDIGYGPHTSGGCESCKGALTIDGSAVKRNVSYYIIAQVSKFITPGSLRIGSTESNTFSNVAFMRPDGKKVLLVLNENTSDVNFFIKYKGALAQIRQSAGSAATYIW